MNNENLQPVEKLTPFTKMVMSIGTLPSSFYASMSYYESMVWLYEYLKNEVIPTVNNNGDAVEELQGKFLELNEAFETLESYIEHYFENLDVQQEINNKLDQMALDGTLTNLIKAYIDPLYQAYENEINEIVQGQNTEISLFKNEVTGQITTIDDKVTSVASGSPAGVYATVAALTSADPDHSKIYVVTETGNWYYYANNQWNSGGTYQGSLVGESDPLYKYLNSLLNLEKINLTSVTSDYYFNNNLVKTSSNSFNLTDPIEVKKGEAIILYAKSVNAGVSVITVTDSEEHPMYPANRGIDSNSNYYVYKAEQDSYVMLSLLKTDTGAICYKGIDSNYLLEQSNNLIRLNNNNLFNKKDITSGYVNTTNGHFEDSASWYYTRHLIPVENNKIYKFFGGSCFISEYDEDYGFIQTTTYGTTTGTITTSNTTKYVRLSVNGTYLESYMFCDSSYSGDYEDYFEGYSSSNILDLNVGNAIKYHTINVGPLETFTTITSALNNISDNNYFNRYKLFIKKGTYDEMIHCKNYVDLIGEDKYQSIIHYTSDNESDYVNRSTIYCDYNCNIENLTIETTGTKYPIHIDNNLGTFEINIKNCYIKHNGFTSISNQAGTAIGIGLYQGQNVNIEKCDIIATPYSTLFGAAGIYCHNQNNGGNGYRSLTVKNCNINATTYGVRFESIESTDQGQKNDGFIIGNNNSANTPIRISDTPIKTWNVIEFN